MDTRHDLVQALVYLLGSPSHTHRVLSHLQTRGGYTTGIHSLARSEELTCSDELVDGLCCTTHVRNLGYAQWLLSQDLVGILAIELVLSGTRQIDISLLLPWLLTCKELRTGEFFLVGLADVITAGTEFQHVLYLLCIQTFGIIDVAVRTRDGDNLGTQFSGLLGCTPGHITETRECYSLALNVKTVSLHHVVNKV